MRVVAWKQGQTVVLIVGQRLENEMRKVLYDDSELTPEEMLAAAAAANSGPDGWDAPGMDVYMNVSRGDVVLVPYPQALGQPPKRRPALVVQSDHNNGRLTNSIFTMITSNTSLAGRQVRLAHSRRARLRPVQ